MAAIAATNSATPSLQSALIRSRLQAAQREADRAEAYAESLQQQADDQNRVVMRTRQRVRSIKDESLASPSSAATTPTSAKLPASEPDNYIDAISNVFQLAKPIFESSLSAPQKDIVVGSLLVSTNKAWSSRQISSQAVQRYSSQANQLGSASPGRVLNTTA